MHVNEKIGIGNSVQQLYLMCMNEWYLTDWEIILRKSVALPIKKIILKGCFAEKMNNKLMLRTHTIKWNIQITENTPWFKVHIYMVLVVHVLEINMVCLFSLQRLFHLHDKRLPNSLTNIYWSIDNLLPSVSSASIHHL